MAYICTIVHYYLWEGGGQDEGRYFIIEDFINRGGRGGVKPINEQFIKYTVFFFEVVNSSYGENWGFIIDCWIFCIYFLK